MAQTIRDFLTECELYPYSREAFDLMKECAEVTVLEKYIENQEFASRNAGVIGNYTFTEGYFMEASTAADVQSMKDALSAKKTSILSKIASGWEKLMEMFAKFLKKFVDFINPISHKSTAILQSLRKISLDKERVESLKNAIKDVYDQFYNESNYEDRAWSNHAKPDMEMLKLSYADTVFNNKKEQNIFEANLATVLSNNYVRLYPSAPKEKVMEINDLISYCEEIIKSPSAKDYMRDIKNRDHVGVDMTSYSIHVDLGTNKIEKSIQKLIQLQSQIKSMKPADSMSDKKDYSDARPEDHFMFNAADFKNFEKSYAALNQCIANTIKMYNGYITTRKKALNNIEAWLKNLKIEDVKAK